MGTYLLAHQSFTHVSLTTISKIDRNISKYVGDNSDCRYLISLDSVGYIFSDFNIIFIRVVLLTHVFIHF